MIAHASATNQMEILAEALNNFKCYKDEDVERFLKEQAIEFEKKGLSTTYLVLDEKELANRRYKVEAFFHYVIKPFRFKTALAKASEKE